MTSAQVTSPSTSSFFCGSTLIVYVNRLIDRMQSQSSTGSSTADVRPRWRLYKVVRNILFFVSSTRNIHYWHPASDPRKTLNMSLINNLSYPFRFPCTWLIRAHSAGGRRWCGIESSKWGGKYLVQDLEMVEYSKYNCTERWDNPD